jgi:hypothetical protein
LTTNHIVSTKLKDVAELFGSCLQMCTLQTSDLQGEKQALKRIAVAVSLTWGEGLCGVSSDQNVRSICYSLGAWRTS